VFTLIDNSFETSDLQVVDSQVAVYFTSAVGVTVLGEPVTPSDHFTVPLHPLAVNVTELPVHITNLSAIMIGLAKSVTVISLFNELALTHVPIEQVAVYEVETNGRTVTTAPVCPSDQITVPPTQPVAVNSSVEPAQMVEVPELTIGGVGFTTCTVTGNDVFASPQPSTVHITE
jgi:hypothetical protein